MYGAIGAIAAAAAASQVSVLITSVVVIGKCLSI